MIATHQTPQCLRARSLFNDNRSYLLKALPVYICVCNRVTDSEVRRCVREGASTLSDLQMQLGVACQCGVCAATALDVLREETDRACDSGPFQLGLSAST